MRRVRWRDPQGHHLPAAGARAWSSAGVFSYRRCARRLCLGSASQRCGWSSSEALQLLLYDLANRMYVAKQVALVVAVFVFVIALVRPFLQD
jgi:hypothetical protein